MSLEVTDMELRDWFAGMALQGLLTLLEAWPPPGKPQVPSNRVVQDAARKAYQVADAMMAERTKPAKIAGRAKEGP